MTRHASIAFTVVLSLAAGFASAAAPKVVITSPDNGEIDVDPAVNEIRIEFDQPMDARGRSITGGGESFPKFSGPPKWANEKTMVIPVTLQPEHDYYLGVNSESFKGFVNKRGEPAEWYPISFKTRGAGATPAEPDVTAGQNKEALAALKGAIDDAYSYRDRKKIDWAKEIAKRQAK